MKSLRLLLPGALLVLVSAAQSAEHSYPSSVVAPGAKLVTLYEAERFFEGPTWDPQTAKLYFTSFQKTGPRSFNPETEVLRLDEPGKATVWLAKAEGLNGTCLAQGGGLLGAQAFGHRLMRFGFGPTGPSSTRVVLYDPSLNQPNDVCQAPNGDIYFTDPDFKERKASAVYRLNKDGKPQKILDDMPLPNGLKTSLDGKTLYVGDSHEQWWRSYPIHDDDTVGAGRVFFKPTDWTGVPDGFCLDSTGRLYLSAGNGLWVVEPDGKPVGLIPLDTFCSNATFGGPDGRTLYMTCDKKLYSLAMQVRGPQSPAKVGAARDMDSGLRSICVDILRAALNSDEFWPSMHAAEALTLAGAGADVRSALEPQLAGDSDVQHRCGLARELVRAGDTSRVSILFEILASPDPYGHTHAAESLYKIRQTGDGRSLRAAMERGETAKLQLIAAGALASKGDATALALIRERLTTNEVESRWVAAWLLARLGDTSDIPALTQCVGIVKDPFAKAYIENALAALGDPNGLAALRRNLYDHNPDVRAYSAETVGYMRATQFTSRLEQLLADAALDVRVRTRNR